MTREFDAGATWVVKVGSSLITKNGDGLAVDLISGWVDDIAEIHRRGIRVVLVSSGAVAEGMARLGMTRRPDSVHLLQAAAAVGQMGLIQVYESNFQRHQLHTAQHLLTHADLRSRERYLNARSCLRALLDLDVIPVVNENDTVVTEEIRLGDNDTLASLVVNLIEANTLVLLTDQQGVYRRDPKLGASELILETDANDPVLDKVAGAGGSLGRGGMVTKIHAARIAARSGADTIIAPGNMKHILRDLADGRLNGTLLRADREPLVARKRWLATLTVQGQVVLDHGAVTVLQSHGRSLLPVGVKGVQGSFTRGDMVSCVDSEGKEVARGLINYGADEVSLIAGKPSSNIESILGYVYEEELIHRDDLVLA